MSLFNLKWIGVGQSPKTPGADASGIEFGEKFIGMENFGNTCYANSILQALYHSKAFRDCVVNFPNTPPTGLLYPPTPVSSTTSSYFGSSSPLHTSTPITINPLVANGPAQHARTATSTSNTPTSPSTNSTLLPTRADTVTALSGLTPQMQESLFTCMRDLFLSINGMKKRTGVIAPNGFVTKLRKENELFRSTMHQDAHEFLNYLLNAIAENVSEFNQSLTEESSRKHSPPSNTDASLLAESDLDQSVKQQDATVTWVHRLFEGVLTNETRCLTCETVTNKDESFLDLSIDIEQHSSVTACLRQFSASELLCQRNKFFCDKCCGLQEAEKRMKIKRLPNLLALHLKRFKYQEKLQKYIKLTYRVVFPFELRLFNTSDDTENPDRLYELYAIVVHIGAGPYHGHYIAIIKSGGKWWTFDDQNVDMIEESDIEKYYGDIAGQGSGYVLFYQAIDLDMDSLGLVKAQSSSEERAPSSLTSSHLIANDKVSNGSAVPPLGSTDGNALALNTNGVDLANATDGAASSKVAGSGAVPIPRDRKSVTSPALGAGVAFADRFFSGSGRKKDASTGSKDLSRKKSALASMTSWKGGIQEPESADESGGEKSNSQTSPHGTISGQTTVVLPSEGLSTPKKLPLESSDANGASSVSSWFRRKEKADRKDKHPKDISAGTDDMDSTAGDFSETESTMDPGSQAGDIGASPSSKKKSKGAKLPRRISLSLSKSKKIAKESGEDLEEVLSTPVPKTPEIPQQFLNQPQGRHG